MADRSEVPRRPLVWVLTAACVSAAAAYLFIAWLLAAPSIPLRLFYRLALWCRVPFPLQGAEYLIFRARPLVTALFLKLACAAFLFWVAASSRRERRTALVVLCLFAMVDPPVRQRRRSNRPCPQSGLQAGHGRPDMPVDGQTARCTCGRLFGEIDSRTWTRRNMRPVSTRERHGTAVRSRSTSSCSHVGLADPRADFMPSPGAVADRRMRRC